MRFGGCQILSHPSQNLTDLQNLVSFFKICPNFQKSDFPQSGLNFQILGSVARQSRHTHTHARLQPPSCARQMPARRHKRSRSPRRMPSPEERGAQWYGNRAQRLRQAADRAREWQSAAARAKATGEPVQGSTHLRGVARSRLLRGCEEWPEAVRVARSQITRALTPA